MTDNKISFTESKLRSQHASSENRVQKHLGAIHKAHDDAFHIDSVKIAKNKGYNVKTFDDLTSEHLEKIRPELIEAALDRHKKHVLNHYVNEGGLKKIDEDDKEYYSMIREE